MNPNNSSSRRNRSGTPQQDPNQQDPNLQSPQGGFQPFPQQDPNQQFPQGGFQPFSQGFQPFSQVAFQQMSQQYAQQFPFQSLLSQGQPFPQGFQGCQGFQGSQPSQYQLPTTPTFNLDDDDDDDEDEIVPDTQEPSRSTPTRNDKGKKKKFENRAKPVRWTREEEIALAKAWVDVSEDAVVGNSQTGAGFWKRVLKVFYSLLGQKDPEKDPRSHHQANSKWRDMNAKVTLFSGIYNNLMNNRSSGQSDDDILSIAYKRFQSQSLSNFTFEHVWEVVKNCPKWKEVPPMPSRSSRGSKRTSNDDAEDNAHVVEPQRPCGRDRAKRGNTSGSSPAESPTELLSDIQTLKRSVDTSRDYRMQKLAFDREKMQIDKEKMQLDREKMQLERERLKVEQNRILKEDIEFYLSSHEHLTGSELMATLYRKQQLKESYGWDF